MHVRLLTLGHHLGGKASSWRDREGRLIDHGQHVVAGFYREMKELLRRATVDVEAHLWSNRGVTHVYEDRDGEVHDLRLSRNPLATLASCMSYSGFTAAELANIATFVFRTAAVWTGVQDVRPFDDVCFPAFCWKNGLSPEVMRTNAFRMSQCAQLNWPGQISAYQLLGALGRFDRGWKMCEYGFPDGGMTETFWNPVGAYLSRLGGELSFLSQVTGLRHDGKRVTAIEVGEPDSGGHDAAPSGHSGPQKTTHVKPDSTFLMEDVDATILAVPEGCFRELNPDDAVFWSMPPFAGMRRLKSVPPLALQVWHREPLTKQYESVISGLPEPLSFVLDNKPIVREYRDDPRYGSVLYFVGQERGFEDWSDSALLEQCLDAVRPLPGFERVDRNGILHHAVIRNRGPHGRYWYSEPGSTKYRPERITPFSNLFLAGDWVRNELDFPCMEAAVRSGLAAADSTLEAFA